MNQSQRIRSDADPNAISIDEARKRIQERLPAFLETEYISCLQAHGRVTASDIVSPLSVPPFRASAMDGYALRVHESESTLNVSERSLAGHPGPDALPPGTCQRITTGARVPNDADAVVQQENVELTGNQIRVKEIPSIGLNIREPGTDSREGTILIQANCLLGAVQLALLAAHGVTEVCVYQPLRVALFSTGDELNLSHEPLATGQIYDANRPLLNTLLSSNAVHVMDLGICRDTEEQIEGVFSKAKQAHLVVSSGGVSVGEADYVRTVLEKRGRVDLWKIAMKPGRPLTFGLSLPNQAYFGLPGNPVSAAITCLLFVKPAICHILGLQQPAAPPLYLNLQGDLFKNPGRVEYQRAIMTQDEHGDWFVGTTGLQDSHVLSSLHKANCLIELPLNATGARHGEQVRVIPFSHFGTNSL